MHSPAAAIAWQLFRPYRWWLVAGIAYFLAVSIFCRVTPETAVFFCRVTPETAVFAVAGLYLASPLGIGMLLLLTVFAYGSGFDLASQESGFPARMFALPVQSRALVGWPMFYGTIAVGLAWMAIGQFLLRPSCRQWIDVPLWWPAFFGAGFLAWYQALTWWPFALAWLRLVVSIPVFGLLIAVPILGNLCDVPEAVMVLVLAAQLPVAYTVAVAGVSRARRGDNPDWRWVVQQAGNLVRPIARRRRTFASAAEAQSWFEWRLNGLSLPLGVCIMLPYFAALVFVHRANADLGAGSPLRSLLLLSFMPVLMAGVMGGALSRFGHGRNGELLAGFLATRPLDSAALVLAKLKTAARSVLGTYAVVFAAVALLVVLAGAYGEVADLWSLLADRLSPAKAGAIMLLAVVGLVAGTWALAVEN